MAGRGRGASMLSLSALTPNSLVLCGLRQECRTAANNEDHASVKRCGCRAVKHTVGRLWAAAVVA